MGSKPGQLVLSLFPGIDLLGRAFGEAGFSVVAGPDVIFGGDVRGWHVPPGRFDGVIGGPPCQAFSPLRHIVKHNGHKAKFGNLIPEFERIVAAAEPAWWLMEEVPEAPLPAVPGYAAWSCLLDNRQLGEAQQRIRRWTFGVPGPDYHVLMIDTVALMNPRFEYAACGGHGGTLARVDKRRVRKPGSVREYRHNSSCLGQNFKTNAAFAELKRQQGLPEDFELPGWLVTGKCQAVGNGVPMAMGRALAKAVIEYTTALARPLTTNH